MSQSVIVETDGGQIITAQFYATVGPASARIIFRKKIEMGDAYFGNDNQSPFREKPAIVKIDFDKDGKIFVSKDQPDFVLQK